MGWTSPIGGSSGPASSSRTYAVLRRDTASSPSVTITDHPPGQKNRFRFSERIPWCVWYKPPEDAGKGNTPWLNTRLFLCFRLRHIYMAPPAMRRRPATPPTAPPTAAPIMRDEYPRWKSPLWKVLAVVDVLDARVEEPSEVMIVVGVLRLILVCVDELKDVHTSMSALIRGSGQLTNTTLLPKSASLILILSPDPHDESLPRHL